MADQNTNIFGPSNVVSTTPQFTRPTFTPVTPSTGSTWQTVQSYLYSRQMAYAVIVLILIVLVYYWYVSSSLTGKLKKQGWSVYYQPGCPHCTSQKKLLDSNGGDVPSYVCGAKSGHAACKSASGFPYWVNSTSGATRVGLQTQKALEQMAKGTN